MKRLLSIRGKMAILILALAVVNVNALWQATGIVRTVKQKLQLLDAETSAALSANAILKASDEELAISITRTRLAGDAADLERVEKNFAQNLAETEAALSVVPIEAGDARPLLAQLEQLEDRMTRLFDARQSVLQSEEQVERRLGELAASTARLAAALAVLMTDLLTVADQELSREQILTQSANQVQFQALADSLMLRLADFQATSGPSRLETLSDARARADEVMEMIDVLDPGAPTEAVAAVLDELSGLIDTEGPVVAALKNLDVARGRFAITLSDVNAARRAADRLTAETTNAARNSIQTRRQQVFVSEAEDRRRQAIWLATIVLSILLIVWWVTDRQVVRRIEGLTAEMKRVADGDLDTPVASGGQDEIGMMANALSIFRLNAIELRRSNEDLGNFAYAASHDLRSPLRAIRNLVDWTIEDAGDQIPDDVLSNLEMIRSRSDRLSRLLTDLLDYARAGSGEMPVEVVHLPGLVRDIAEIVDPDRVFSITFSGDRCISSVKTPLQTILLNLVSNAVKHHDRETGKVAVSHRTEGGMSLIAVADDGPGVPDQYEEKVFELFQTLKSSDEVEGSGMGLAMVRKLVSELGGTIELRAHESGERGAKFIIAIPVSGNVEFEDGLDEPAEEGTAA